MSGATKGLEKVDLRDIQMALINKGLVCSSEAEFSRMVAVLLDRAGIEAQAEVRLTPEDRIDFMVGSIGLELKVRCTAAGMLRQLRRYAASPRVDQLVTVTPSTKLANGLPDIIGGKNHTVILMGAW